MYLKRYFELFNFSSIFWRSAALICKMENQCHDIVFNYLCELFANEIDILSIQDISVLVQSESKRDFNEYVSK